MTQGTQGSAFIEVENDGLATVWLNRPDRLNAWSTDVSGALLEVLQKAEVDSAVKGIVLTGKGRAFCAGADLKNPHTHRIDSIAEHLANADDRGRPIFDLMSHYKKPIMAAVNGYSIGIGCLMPLCCDFIYASESAKFQLPQVTLGIMPAYGGPLRLARAVGKLNAAEMTLTGRMVSAQEALRWGMVSQLFPDDQLLAASKESMRSIIQKPPYAVAFARESLETAVDAGNMRAAETADALRFMILAQLDETKNQHENWRKRR